MKGKCSACMGLRICWIVIKDSIGDVYLWPGRMVGGGEMS